MTCTAALPRARAAQARWHRVGAEIGLGFSLDKRQGLTQCVNYLGTRLDTMRGTRSIMPEKLDKLLASVDDLAVATTITPRQLDSVGGRARHYADTIRFTRVPTASLAHGLSTDPPGYDRPMLVPPALAAVATELSGIIRRYAAAGAPLWPPVPSSLWASFLRGDLEALRVYELVWDASPAGWAARFRTRPAATPLWVAGTWPPDTPAGAQAHREAFGGTFAFRAVAEAVHLGGAMVIMRNDAEAALAALRKGSTQSPEMQAAALELNRMCANLDTDTVFLHSPGLEMIADGVDARSRDEPQAARGPECTPALWDQVLAATRALGWSITVDAFAVAANAKVPRFFSRFPEPQAEAADAFSVPDWRASWCPVCEGFHEEVLFAFPPPAMMRLFVRKAVADGVRAVVVTTLAPSAPYWTKLIRASVGHRPEGFVRIRTKGAVDRYLAHAGTFTPDSLVIMLCDFALLPDAAPRFVPDSSDCPGRFLPRPRCSLGQREDDAVVPGLRRALARALRPGAPHVLTDEDFDVSDGEDMDCSS